MEMNADNRADEEPRKLPRPGSREAREIKKARESEKAAERNRQDAADRIATKNAIRRAKMGLLSRKEPEDDEPTDTVRHEDGSTNRVRRRGVSLTHLERQEQDALQRVAADWEVQFAGLRCRGFEPTIASGEAHKAHLLRIQAMRRLARLKKEIGTRSYVLILTYMIANCGPAWHRRKSGIQHAEVSGDLKRIIREVDTYYNGDGGKKDPVWEEAEKVFRQMEMDLERGLV